MSFMSIAKPLAYAHFADSGSPFDGWISFGSPREAAFRPSGRSTAGFRRLGGRAEVRQKRRNHPVDPDRRQASCVIAALPGQPQVLNARPRQPQLGKAPAMSAGWSSGSTLGPMGESIGEEKANLYMRCVSKGPTARLHNDKHHREGPHADRRVQ